MVQISGGTEGLVYNGGHISFLRCQICIATGQGKSICLTDCIHNNNLHVHIQIFCNSSNEATLSRVLLSKVCMGGLYNIKEFGDHGCHSTEMSRTRHTLRTIIKPCRIHVSSKILPKHHVMIRCKQVIHAHIRQELEIRFHLTRVLVQIFPFSELRRVDKDGCYNNIVLYPSLFYKRQVTLVQCPHSWNETYSGGRLKCFSHGSDGGDRVMHCWTPSHR
mmetsp:Transcript_13852/g.25069  ORF Transcript_13852/g.25069 Transcript_13852/m.25069 type:complete len:219 (-) Transcript_13852:122-778(-)